MIEGNDQSARVAMVSGFWGQNIGNGFFNLGGKWILEQVFGSGNVQFIQDQPSYRTFYNQSKGPPTNYARLLNDLDVDYIVLQGPMLTSTFRPIWEYAFREFKRRGIRVILLGAAFFKYTVQEIADAKAFLAEYPPYLISTRDAKTHEIVKDWVSLTYNGLDSAFFIPKFFVPLRFTNKYVTFNFDRFPEPDITLGEMGDEPADISFDFLGETWHLKIPRFQQYFSRKGKAQAYFGHLLDFRSLPENILGNKILRPEHRYIPHMTHKIYQHPNAFVSDEIFTYLSVYAGTRLTLSDRVHACVISLAFGNPAMLFNMSPRQALFARIGLENICKHPVTLDLHYLEHERQAQIDFLMNAV